MLTGTGFDGFGCVDGGCRRAGSLDGGDTSHRQHVGGGYRAEPSAACGWRVPI